MKRQIYALLVMVGIICAYFGYNAYTQQVANGVGGTSLWGVIAEYRSTLKENSKDYSAELNVVSQEISNIQNEINILTNQNQPVINGVEQAEENTLLQMVTDYCDRNGLKLEKFYADSSTKSYTVRVSGTLSNIDNANYGLMTDLSKYNVSVGEMSLRQDYSAYNLQRAFDGTSLLEWYDSKFVNILGTVMSVGDVQDDGVLTITDTSSSAITIDENKKKIDIDAATSDVKSALKGLDAWYSIQSDSIRGNMGITIEERAQQLQLLTAEYENRKAPLNIELDRITNRINKEYETKLEEEKAKAENVAYKLKKIQATLANSEDLIYTYDFTFRVGM